MSLSGTGTPRRQSSPTAGAPQTTNDSGEINFHLTREDASVEERREGFALLKALAARPASLDRRQAYYDTIVTPANHSIIDLQIGALDTLTDGGRILVPFEAELLIFLNNTLKDLSIVTERLREEKRGNGPRASVYGAESPNRGAEKNLSSNEPVGAEKALLVGALTPCSSLKPLTRCITGHFLYDCKRHQSSSPCIS